MTHNPTISIIIPVYKAEQYLRRCLDSVLAQSYADWECVCVDDGSPDGSGAILDEYAARDGRFRVIHQTNAGVSAARNAALDVARGEFVCFIDADDWVERDYVSAMAKHSDYDIVVCGYSVDEYRDAQDVHPLVKPALPEDVDCHTLPQERLALIPLLRMGMLHVNCNKILRRSIIEEHHVRYRHYPVNEDNIFQLEFLQHARSIRTVRLPLYHWVQIMSARSGVTSMPENLLSIYLESHRLTEDLLQSSMAANEILYYTYFLLVRRALIYPTKGWLTMEQGQSLLRQLYAEPRVREAFRRHRPSSIGEAVGHYLVRFRMLGIYRGLFLRNFEGRE